MECYLREYIDPKAQPFTLAELDQLDDKLKHRILATIKTASEDESFLDGIKEEAFERGYEEGWNEGHSQGYSEGVDND